MTFWKAKFILGLVSVFTFSLLCPSLMQLPKVQASHVMVSCGQNMPGDEDAPTTDNSHCQQKYKIAGIQVEKEIKDIVSEIIPVVSFYFELPFFLKGEFPLVENTREKIDRRNIHITTHKKE